MSKPRILILPKDKSLVMETEYGTVTYEHWVELEKKRIGGGCEVKYSRDKKQVWLTV